MQDDRIGRALAVVRAALDEQGERLPSDSRLLDATIDELGLNSLTKLELVLNLETEFDTMANESEIAACRTVGELVDLVSRTRA